MGLLHVLKYFCFIAACHDDTASATRAEQKIKPLVSNIPLLIMQVGANYEGHLFTVINCKFSIPWW